MSERVVVDPPTVVPYKVGACPGCKTGIYAEVRIVTEVHPPRLDADGRPVDCAHAVIIASRLTHSCKREVDGEWELTSAEVQPS